MTFWNGVLWLHLLGMAFFVGGQMMLGGVVVPVLRGAENRETLLAAARRFGIGTAIAFAVLIVTGIGLASHEHKWSDSTLHVKLGLVALLGIAVGAHMRRPQSHALDGVVFGLSVAIVWLGIVVGE
jgi:putative copper export protein